MDISNLPINYGPWIISKILVKKEDCIIADVILNNNSLNVSYENIINLTKWVIKIRSHEINELIPLLFIFDNNIKNIIKIPSKNNNFYNYGIFEHGSWYVMKKYTCQLSNELFFRNNFKNLAMDGIKFMKSLHKYNHIYADFKFGNTFYDTELQNFVFVDYDSIFYISDSPLSNYSNDYKYYYLTQGGELEHPYRSFKFDLISFGYLLGKVTYDKMNFLPNYLWEFEKLSDDLRHKATDPSSDVINNIIKLRNLEQSKFNPLILKYFEIVNEMSWTLTSYKPEIYDKLMDLFFISDEL